MYTCLSIHYIVLGMFSIHMQEDADEAAARQRLGRLGTRGSATQSSRLSTGVASSGRQASAPDSTSGQHVAPPKLSQDDGWAAELDNDDSWDSLEHKPAAGEKTESEYGIPL